MLSDIMLQRWLTEVSKNISDSALHRLSSSQYKIEDQPSLGARNGEYGLLVPRSAVLAKITYI